MLELVRLSGLGGRKPVQLSGGQRQRVALARAIVNEPEVLLLDEPLGALDLKLRQEMQTELKRIQREVGITFIYVTHDQEEALTMSDRLAVLNRGQIEQIGTPVEVYERPATEFVAGFIGVSNLIDHDGDRLTVRPEKVHLLLDDAEPVPAGAHLEHGVIDEVVYLGVVTRYRVELDGGGALVAVRQNLEAAAAEVLGTTRPTGEGRLATGPGIPDREGAGPLGRREGARMQPAVAQTEASRNDAGVAHLEE